MTPSSSRWLIPLAIVVLALDQITKSIALSQLKFGESVPVFGDFVRWTLVLNPGGAFSLSLGNPTYYLLTSIFIFAFLVFYIIYHRRTACIAIPLSIVAGGAAGNIIDRLRFGRVVDFIDCEFFDISVGSYHLERWPIFNVADSAVSCGIIMTIFLIYLHSHREKTSDLTETPPPAA